MNDERSTLRSSKTTVAEHFAHIGSQFGLEQLNSTSTASSVSDRGAKEDFSPQFSIDFLLVSGDAQTLATTAVNDNGQSLYQLCRDGDMRSGPWHALSSVEGWKQPSHGNEARGSKLTSNASSMVVEGSESSRYCKEQVHRPISGKVIVGGCRPLTRARLNK